MYVILSYYESKCTHFYGILYIFNTLGQMMRNCIDERLSKYDTSYTERIEDTLSFYSR